MELSIAALADADVPAVVDLCREALDLPEDAAEAGPIVARLREHSGLGFVATADGELAGVVLASLSHRDASIGHIDLVAVRPAARRQGIGRALLTRAEGALAGHGAVEVLLAGNPPYYAWPGIDVRYTPAICVANALGYEQDRTAWNMTADLTEINPTEAAERRLAESGVEVRRAEPGDVAALVDFARANFSDGWAGEVSDSVGREGAGCYLALRDGEVLGFAAYGSSRPSWFGPMGTAPSAQGLGIGGVLLRRCLRDLREAGLRRAEIGWVGPVPFYASAVGARIERVFFLYRKEL